MIAPPPTLPSNPCPLFVVLIQMSCLNADVVVLLFATDRPQTLSRVSSYWMPELRRLQVTVPIVLVGTKSDLKPNDQQLQQVGGRRMAAQHVS